MSGIEIRCAQCGVMAVKPTGSVNRSRAAGAPLYCGKTCSGMARRLAAPRTDDEKRELKRIHDAQYRAANSEKRKVEKAAYHARTYDPAKAAIKRKATMAQHVEYCRQPEYKAKKAAYDKQRRYARFGPFAEAAMLLDDLDKEVRARATRYEIYIANGRFTRSAQQRRRELWQAMKRN